MEQPPSTDHLFAVPLPDFIAERKRMAKALRDAGLIVEAKAVEKIPRPTVPAWTVNQIARRDPDLIKQLGALTSQLRAAQLPDTQSSAEWGGAPEYAAAALEHRSVLAALRVAAAEVLAGAGHAASPPILRRVIANLRGGVSSPETRSLVENGRLSRDIEERDFTALFEGAIPAAPAQEKEKEHGKAKGMSVRVRADAPKAAQQQLRQVARQGVRDEARQRRSQAAADRAEKQRRARERLAIERRVRQLRAAGRAAREALEKQERAITDARQTLLEGEKHLLIARKKADAAERELKMSEAELAGLGPA